MSDPAQQTAPGSLLETIKTDLAAGVSFLEHEALEAGLGLWNIFKHAFVALEPAAASILVETLTQAEADVGMGKSVEQVETHALATANDEVRAVLIKVGSNVTQSVIAGIRANNAAAPPQ